MANRVTVAEVKQIMDSVDSSLSDANFTIHINAANRIITKLVTASEMSTADLKECERWLSAHFVAMGADPIANMERAATVEQRLDHKLDLGLNNTRYGQMAMMIDTSNALSSSNKGRKKASMYTLNP